MNVLEVLRKIGIDRSIVFTVTNRFVQAAGNLLVIYLVSRHLTQPEQGYYYTFSSIAAMQVFFELGLSVVITQFVAHEFAFLKMDSGHIITGEQKHIERISSLLRFIVKWYSFGAIALFLVVTPCGIVFFEKYKTINSDVLWLSPWVLLMISTSLNLGLSAYVPFLEGFNKVKEVARFRIVQSTLSLMVLCLSINLDLGLFGLGLYALSNFILLLGWIVTNHFRRFLITIWNKYNESVIINWKTEIFPLQWRIALSWLSGYFIFQLFNPIVFAFEGPVVAGQMGITLTAFNGITVVAMAWVSTKIPTYSMMIAQRKFKELDELFFRSMKQSFVLISSAVLIFIVGLALLQNNYFPAWRDMGQRFLPINLALFTGLTTVVNQLIFSMAAYLRSHKKEPLLANSVIGAILTICLVYLSARWLGIRAVVISNFLLTLILGLSWVTYIFYTKRKEWHASST